MRINLHNLMVKVFNYGLEESEFKVICFCAEITVLVRVEDIFLQCFIPLMI